ncbi:hypothetical protein [Methanoculleus sp.]|uniref:hypothetical protein n=1 Tax=Methanoculleus sp. TaxID=90427 RepID=UPI00320D0AE8
MTWVYKSFLVVAVMILILASAGCAELPAGGESGWSGLFSPSESPETPDGQDADPGYLTPVTPYPTATSSMAGPTFSRPPEVAPTPDMYVTIYNRTAQFTQTTEAFAFDLTAPPLLIDFTVEPKMITREKYATSDYDNIKSGMVKQTFPSETSWFKVTVRDRGTGAIVAENGFGKLYSADTHKQIYVGRSGDYQIELAGNDVKVHVLMRAGGV